jgi:imidazolonepropionase-like amidohydrolase
MSSVLYRAAALADGRSADLRLGISLLVSDGHIAWIRPSDGEEELPKDTEVVDSLGATIVPGLVDCHSHLTGLGGANWIARFSDPPERLRETAERNGALMMQAGIRWARDVGAPAGPDGRALTLALREEWKDRRDRPYVRAAGTWVTRAGTIPGITVEAADADQLLAQATHQLDTGADFVKLYLDGPEPGVAPWSGEEVARVVAAARARGAKVTAHSGHLAGARVCVAAGVDSIEHGFELDAEACREMAAKGIVLVSTLTVLRSWATFSRTTSLPRFTSEEGLQRLAARRELAIESVRKAHSAGVTIAAGTDFGGGSARANQLAWEVEALVDAGLQPWEALGAATWRGGDLLGENGAGRIEPDGHADFFLVHGDPYSDPAALWRVWRTAWS